MNRKKYRASKEKFKKLYFYKFLFAQVWFSVNVISIFIVVYVLPDKWSVWLSLPIPSYTYTIQLGLSSIIWFLSIPWYGIKADNRRRCYLVKRNDSFVYKTVKQTLQQAGFGAIEDDCIYTIKNISNVRMKKYSIFIYGDINMKRRTTTGIIERYYSQVKIPNIFDDIDFIAQKNKNVN